MTAAEMEARLLGAEEWLREAAHHLRALRLRPDRAAIGVGAVMITADAIVRQAAGNAEQTLSDGVHGDAPSAVLARVPEAIEEAARRRIAGQS